MAWLSPTSPTRTAVCSPCSAPSQKAEQEAAGACPGSSLDHPGRLRRRYGAGPDRSGPAPEQWHRPGAAALACPVLCGSQQPPYLLRRKRRIGVLDPERLQGVHHGVGDGGGNADGATLADTLGAQRVEGRGGRLELAADVHAKICGTRDPVVREGRRQRLSRLVIAHFLPEGRGQPLGDGAMDLARC